MPINPNIAATLYKAPETYTIPIYQSILFQFYKERKNIDDYKIIKEIDLPFGDDDINISGGKFVIDSTNNVFLTFNYNLTSTAYKDFLSIPNDIDNDIISTFGKAMITTLVKDNLSRSEVTKKVNDLVTDFHNKNDNSFIMINI